MIHGPDLPIEDDDPRVTLSRDNPCRRNDEMKPEPLGVWWIDGDGQHKLCPGRCPLRNAPMPADTRSPELVERMVEAIKLHLSPEGNAEPLFRAILAELDGPAADPLVIEAREIAIEVSPGHSDAWKGLVRAGHHDDYSEVRAALVALRRSQEQQS